MAKLTVAKAADQWEAAKRKMQALQVELDAAAGVLKDYFRASNRRDYKGRIGYSLAVQHRLDTEKVKAELGKRLPDFQRPVTIESLSLLK
jgi:hypothetical protein